MAVSLSRKKSKAFKKSDRQKFCFCFTIWFRVLSHIPSAAFLLILIFLWSSSTTIISNNIFHVCISSRKLNNLYCLSAGSHPNLEIPVSVVNDSSTSPRISGNTVSKIDGNSSTVDGVREINELVSPITTNNTVKEIVNDVEEEPKLNLIEGISNGRGDDDEIEKAKKVVEQQLQQHRSWMSNTNPEGCEGRGIYVYDLPSKFNKDLVGQCGDMVPWTNFCKYFDNGGFGNPIEKLGKGWYLTHQYSLEPIFHARILKHPCRVYNENEGKLFYVPYYGGLDILRWHFRNVSDDVKDILALELMKWLQSKKAWVQNSGRDHVFVLGKISWDFRRRIGSPWGTRFLNLEQMQNPIKLLIERQPWEVREIGIPHPTFFHPHSDADIVSWQLKISRATRKNLVSFAGAARPDQPESIRSFLINQCTSAGDKCKFVDCKSGGCDQPEAVIELFAESEFCLQPPGDSPTRKSVFDSLVSGCIPVLFDPFTAYYQYPWHLPEDHSKYSVFIDQEEVRQMKVNVVERLMNVTVKEREDMRRYIIYELLPGLVYGDSSSELEKFQDAFSITVNNLLEGVTRLQ